MSRVPVDPTVDGVLAPGQFLLFGSIGRLMTTLFLSALGFAILRGRLIASLAWLVSRDYCCGPAQRYCGRAERTSKSPTSCSGMPPRVTLDTYTQAITEDKRAAQKSVASLVLALDPESVRRTHRITIPSKVRQRFGRSLMR